VQDIVVEVTFRSGELATFVVPKTITLQDFGELVALCDSSGVRTFQVSRPSNE